MAVSASSTRRQLFFSEKYSIRDDSLMNGMHIFTKQFTGESI